MCAGANEALERGRFSDVEIASREHGRLLAVRELFSSRGFPSDLKAHEHRASGRFDAVTAERLDLTQAAELEILAEHLRALSVRESEYQRDGRRYSAFSQNVLIPVHMNNSFYATRFIVAPVGQEDFGRVWPVKFPPHVGTLYRNSGGSLGNRIRLFGQLVRVYSEAVRLSRDDVRFPRDLVRSLSLLVGHLSQLVTEAGLAKANYPDDDAGDSDKRGDGDSSPGGG